VFHKAHDRTQHSGLAGTVRAEKRYRFALVHAKINIAHDVEAAVAGEQ